eukprot:15445334-Alexandrium_andersonii.AAC.1
MPLRSLGPRPTRPLPGGALVARPARPPPVRPARLLPLPSGQYAARSRERPAGRPLARYGAVGRAAGGGPPGPIPGTCRGAASVGRRWRPFACSGPRPA